jgi:uncharacterized membrane protein YgaE (UPF0421/DUF939 family)
MNNLMKRAASSVTGQRALLAAKTTIAVGLSWWLATQMPGVVDEYPYYAPLGALVCMYPTFMGSVRSGLQTLIGLLLGIALAAGVLVLGVPNIFTISLAVGLGVLLAALPRLGAGREYVPVATLLVLIIGGQNADSFSVGYGVQMALGVVVGLVVNVTIFPPLTLDAARDRISRGRAVLINQLVEAAQALVEQWPPKHHDWAGRRHELDAAVVEIRRAVNEAAESHRANPRAYRLSRHRHVAESFDDLTAIENITFYIRDLTEVLAAAIWNNSLELRLRADLREPLSRSLASTADILRMWEEGKASPGVFAKAQDSVAEFRTAIFDSRETAPAALTPVAAVALDVQRILAELRRRLCPEGDEQTE